MADSNGHITFTDVLNSDEYGQFTGACSVCGLKYNGRDHVCPGALIHHPEKDLMGAQHLDDEGEFHYRQRRSIGQRLEEGFYILQELSEWGA